MSSNVTANMLELSASGNIIFKAVWGFSHEHLHYLRQERRKGKDVIYK